MLRLARAPEESQQVRAIALDECIPWKFLEGIMPDLRRAGLVVSLRGKQGGYRLAKAPEDITFGEIMRVTDGPLALIACASRKFYEACQDCPDEAACVLRQVIINARNEVSAILDRTTLADPLGGRGVLGLMDSVNIVPGRSDNTSEHAPDASPR
jgi:Rrf2 family protein